VRRLLLLVTVAALLLVAPAAGGPVRVQVVAREFSFALSREKVLEGRTIIELANFGQDPHNLRVMRVGGKKLQGTTGPVGPGAQQELLLKLNPGRYRIFCSFADHESRGMLAILTVKSAS
jgi:plastocyanin